MKKALIVLAVLALLVPQTIQAFGWGTIRSWWQRRMPWKEPILRVSPTPSPSGRTASASLVCATGPAVAIENATQPHVAQFRDELMRIRRETGIRLVYQGFPKTSTAADWKTYLDAAQSAGGTLVITFPDGPPTVTPTGVDLGISGEFLSAMKDHPALAALFLIDEPFHEKHGWKITADKLKLMYAQAKKRAPNVPILVQFSREIQKMEEAKGKSAYRFDKGMCDICQISALEFRNYGQGNQFYRDDLIANHSVSRRIINERASGTPVYSSAQVFGNREGKSSYYFPSVEEFQTMIDLLLSAELAKYAALNGIYFQTWTAETVKVTSQQQNLGSAQSSSYRAIVRKTCGS